MPEGDDSLSRRGYSAALGGLLFAHTAGVTAAKSGESKTTTREDQFSDWELIQFRDAENADVPSQRGRGEEVGRGVPFADSLTFITEVRSSPQLTVAYNVRSQSRYDTVSITPRELTLNRVAGGRKMTLNTQSVSLDDGPGVLRLRLEWDGSGSVNVSVTDGLVTYESQVSRQRPLKMGRSDPVAVSGGDGVLLRTVETGRPLPPQPVPSDGGRTLNQKIRDIERQFGSVDLSFDDQNAVLAADGQRWTVEMEQQSGRLLLTDWTGTTHVLSNLSKGAAIRERELNRIRDQMKEVN